MKECWLLGFDQTFHVSYSSSYNIIGAQTFASAEFGQGTGRIVLSYVGCRGTETTLVSCPSSTSYCSHTEDAGVRCQPNG